MLISYSRIKFCGDFDNRRILITYPQQNDIYYHKIVHLHHGFKEIHFGLSMTVTRCYVQKLPFRFLCTIEEY